MRKVTQKYFNIPKGVTSGNFILNQKKNTLTLYFFSSFFAAVFLGGGLFGGAFGTLSTLRSRRTFLGKLFGTFLGKPCV